MKTNENKQPVKVVQQPDNPIAAEIIAQAICDIAEGMKRVSSTRLTRRAIVTLIHEHTKIARRDIEIVLDNLEMLERIWLKPKATVG